MSTPGLDEGVADLHVDDDVELNYKPPPEKSITEILSADAEDESLKKYKEALLGEAKAGTIEIGTWLCD